MAQTMLVVYGDFNCPFCYALSEILQDADLKVGVQWRTIERMSDVRYGVTTPKEQSLLAAQVYTVNHRVQDLTITIPPYRPSSALANQLLLIVSQRTPDKATCLRQLIFRALWIEGKDISDVTVLLALLPAIDFDGSINGDELGEQNSLLQAWQRAWEVDEFQSCVPVMVAKKRFLLGFVLLEDIRRFLNGEQITGDCALSSFVKTRQNIAVYGELTALWSFVEMLRNQYHILALQSETALWELVKTDQLPDLILIDAEVLSDHGLKLCESLRDDDLTRAIPIMLVVDHIDDDNEVRAYRLGVCDVMHRRRSPEVVKARVDMLLQMKLARDELDRAARLDGLTQIYNRREFDRVLLQEWRRCARSQTMLSLLMVDIDKFKNYNDHYGHLAGDGCIRVLAQNMKQTVERTSDLVCRYGGEEFAILLPDTNAEGAQKVAQNILRNINDLKIPHAASDVAGHVTVSIGCCTLAPDTDGDMLALVSIADQRLYLAKNRGRNRIVGENSGD